MPNIVELSDSHTESIKLKPVVPVLNFEGFGFNNEIPNHFESNLFAESSPITAALTSDSQSIQRSALISADFEEFRKNNKFINRLPLQQQIVFFSQDTANKN